MTTRRALFRLLCAGALAAALAAQGQEGHGDVYRAFRGPVAAAARAHHAPAGGIRWRQKSAPGDTGEAAGPCSIPFTTRALRRQREGGRDARAAGARAVKGMGADRRKVRLPSCSRPGV